MREATTKAMPVIVEEERQSRQGRPAGARRAGGHQNPGMEMERFRRPTFLMHHAWSPPADVTVIVFTSTKLIGVASPVSVEFCQETAAICLEGKGAAE